MINKIMTVFGKTLGLLLFSVVLIICIITWFNLDIGRALVPLFALWICVSPIILISDRKKKYELMNRKEKVLHVLAILGIICLIALLICN